MMIKEHTVVGELKIVKIPYEHFLINKNRRIRIWTPQSYNEKSHRPYKVIYMWDGQNIFDEATSYSGEWQVDEAIEEQERRGLQPSVVVALDCSPDRLSEYLPSFSNIAIDNLGYKGSDTLDFLVNRVMPYVESHYNVSRKRENIAIGGSSMGGLMSLAAALFYPNIFSQIYAFSPAFPLFKYGISEEKGESKGLNSDKAFDFVWKKMLSREFKNKFKIVLTSGGVGMEAEYYDYVKRFEKKLLKAGWKKANLLVLQDKNFEHNEKQWSFFFPQAYSFMNK